jgi:hypothetical protein
MVASGRRWSIERFRGDTLPGKERDIQAEAIEVITTRGGQENPADLIVVASDLEFLGGAADGEIVDENLGLIEGAVRDAGQFTELEIAEVLNADPDSDTQHGNTRPSGLPVGHNRNQLSIAKQADTA